MAAERWCLERRVKGLSEGEFRQRFADRVGVPERRMCEIPLGQRTEPCRTAGHAGYAELKGRAVYVCNRWQAQVGLTAGTVFPRTKLPLTVWFLAIYHLTQSKGGIQLGRAGEAARHVRQPGTAGVISSTS